MLKKSKNEIYNLLSSSGLGLNNFEIVEDNSQKEPLVIITYKNTKFKFVIRCSEGSFDHFDYRYVKFSPGFYFTDYLPSKAWTTMNEIIKAIDFWITDHIKKFHENEKEVDLWEEYKKGNHSLNLNAIDFGDKTIFSNDERRQIQMSINELKLLIHQNLSTSEQQQTLVVDRLDYLIEASTRLNKFDWKSLTVATVLSIATALTLDTEKGRVLFELFQKVFSVIPLLVSGN